jgi:formylglycine-generating enzyme required for sulfatase activity
MKQNYKISLCALLLVGAVSTMTARAQGSGSKPTLAVFVVGMQTDALGDALATQIGSELNRNSRYTVLPSAANPVKAKLTELRTQGARSIDRNALAAWGRANGVATICLVTDDIKGSDNMFYAQLIDTKEGKLDGKGSYIRTGVGTSELPRVSSALAKQLEGQGRRRSTPAPTRSYPAELDIEMVFVEGGTFTMGCDPARDGTCYADGREKPTHSVVLTKNFYIGKYTITQAQWVAVMGQNPSSNKVDDQLPVESVSWTMVDTGFLPRLRKLTGKNYRLPTEAEWEYAARGGKRSQGYKYCGSNNANEVAWMTSNSSGKTQCVGRKNPNELGIYDMGGNVYEWCADLYGTYSSSSVQNPTGPTTGTTNRVRRGGSNGGDETFVRSAYRGFSGPSEASSIFGFRVALDAQ